MCFILRDSLQVVSDLQQQQQQQQQPEHILVDANMESNNNNSDKDHQQLLQLHQQQQHQQQHRLHGVLTRTISQPTQRQVNQPPQQQQQQQPPVASLVTIIENLNSMNLHRKLERTQSEPLPPQQPMNTSR